MADCKIDTLMEVEGYANEEDLMDDFSFGSAVPGICMNQGCDYTTDVEPDQCAGWCEKCSTNTVRSCIELILF